ncbi:Multidrug resistance protein MdtE precursor [Pirellulimonas nuda]|uniref:Multidrug resistance protein MdtE n=1 Tax=Pirellulimonas nuda TaxID=2528009 RepID=A0A518DFA1_9BACT|nr:efflux RND transporter periplasmic adaptor subunit [Pirellulimonas nuda]QDU90157.1 Multidrug resistance protein MdtE precursor [Pirellulimonas nuda]
MKKALRRLAKYSVLTAITVAAIFVMWWSSKKDDSAAARMRDQLAAPAPAIAKAKPRVAVRSVEPGLCELTVTFSGKIRPWETYTLGFEVGGRVQQLGVNQAGEMLDVGDRVVAGQVLARLDDRVYIARRGEAVAQFEQATSDLRRARQLYEGRSGALTEAEFQEVLTQMALAKSQQEVAVKNLEDSVLVSPVDGTIADRMAVPGESVGPNEAVFEIVQNDDVLLVVDVPESRVRELQARMRVTRQQDADAPFRAYVQLEGRDMFGQKWPAIEAEVYRIAQVADERTGLFEVEIRIPNSERLLRPGMVATARIVTDEVLGYRVPESAVIFRGRDAHLFTLRDTSLPVRVMFWDIAETEAPRAQRVELKQWVDLGNEVVIPSTAASLERVVVRGQQRLSDGELVRVVNDPGEPPAPAGGGSVAEKPDAPEKTSARNALRQAQ